MNVVRAERADPFQMAASISAAEQNHFRRPRILK
jgi:hypothetical protein